MLEGQLPTVLLLEADFNMNNKAIGADAMCLGKQAQVLARDNCGGCKQLQAAEVNLNAQLTFNSTWGERGRAIIMSNDAKGCYDRMALPHVCGRLGPPQIGKTYPPLQSMIETIQGMEHHIRTALGASD